jgi:hypothetical protein
MTWAEAQANCLSKGAQLASVHSWKENQFIRSPFNYPLPMLEFTNLKLINSYSFAGKADIWMLPGQLPFFEKGARLPIN